MSTLINNSTRPRFSPAFCITTCASIDLLMLDEQTVPIDNLDGCRREDCGGIPGGVYGRCIPGGFMAAYVVERVIGLRERGGNGSRANTLFRKMKGKERKGKV